MKRHGRVARVVKAEVRRREGGADRSRDASAPAAGGRRRRARAKISPLRDGRLVPREIKPNSQVPPQAHLLDRVAGQEAPLLPWSSGAAVSGDEGRAAQAQAHQRAVGELDSQGIVLRVRDQDGLGREQAPARVEVRDVVEPDRDVPGRLEEPPRNSFSSDADIADLFGADAIRGRSTATNWDSVRDASGTGGAAKLRRRT